MTETTTIQPVSHGGTHAGEPLPYWLMPYLSDFYLGLTASSKVRFTMDGGDTVREGMIRHLDGPRLSDDIRSRTVRITLLDGLSEELFLPVSDVLDLMVVGQFFVMQEVKVTSK